MFSGQSLISHLETISIHSEQNQFFFQVQNIIISDTCYAPSTVLDVFMQVISFNLLNIPMGVGRCYVHFSYEKNCGLES